MQHRHHPPKHRVLFIFLLFSAKAVRSTKSDQVAHTPMSICNQWIHISIIVVIEYNWSHSGAIYYYLSYLRCTGSLAGRVHSKFVFSVVNQRILVRHPISLSPNDETLQRKCKCISLDLFIIRLWHFWFVALNRPPNARYMLDTMQNSNSISFFESVFDHSATPASEWMRRTSRPFSLYSFSEQTIEKMGISLHTFCFQAISFLSIEIGQFVISETEK